MQEAVAMISLVIDKKSLPKLTKKRMINVVSYDCMYLCDITAPQL